MAPLLPPVRDWDEYRAVFGDTERLLLAAAAIAQRHHLTGAAPVRFKDGTMLVFAAGDAHVLKVFPPLAFDKLAVERAVLERIEGRLGVDTPGLVAEGELDGWRYLVMRRIAGRSIDEVRAALGPADRVRLAGRLGSAIACLHALPTHGLAPLAADWPAFVERQVAGAFEQQRKHGLPAPWLEQIAPYLASVRPRLPASPDVVLMHTELGPGHVLLTQKAGRWAIAGLIDFADAMLGCAEYELPAVALFVGRADPLMFGAFLAAYGLGAREAEGLAERLMAHALLHRFSNLAWYLREVPLDPPAATLAELAARWFDARSDALPATR